MVSSRSLPRSSRFMHIFSSTSAVGKFWEKSQHLKNCKSSNLNCFFWLKSRVLCMENRNLSGQERLVARHICASLYEGLSADVHPSVCPSVRSFFTESTFLDSRNRGKMSSSYGFWALVLLFGVLMICHAGVQAEGKTRSHSTRANSLYWPLDAPGAYF